MSKYFLVLLVLILAHGTWAQNDQGTKDSAQYYLDKAEGFYKNYHDDSAYVYFTLANQIFKKRQSWNQYTYTNARRGQNLFFLGKVDSAKRILLKTNELIAKGYVSDTLSIYKVYLELGRVYRRYWNKVDSFLYYSSKSRELVRHFKNEKRNSLITTTYYSSGMACWHLYRYEAALLYYDSAMQVMEYDSLAKAETEEYVITNRGNLLMDMGRLNEAINYFKESDKIFRRRLPPDHPDLSYNLISLGQTLLRYDSQQKIQEALAYLKNSEKLIKESFEPEHINLIYTYYEMSRAYKLLGDYDKSLDVLDKAEALNKKIFGDNYADYGYVRELRGEILLAANQLDNAEHELKNSISAYRKDFEEGFKQTGYCYFVLGNVLFKKGEYIHALNAYQQGLYWYVPTTDTTDVYSIPPLDDFIMIEGLVALLRQKSNLLQTLYAENENAHAFHAALETKIAIAKLVRVFSKNYVGNEAKLSSYEEMHDIYEGGIDLALNQFNTSGDINLLEQAFFLADAQKYRLITEHLEEEKARTFTNIPDSILQKERVLKSEINSLKRRLYAQRLGQSSDDFDAANQDINKELFDQQLKLDLLIRHLESMYPNYYQLKYTTSIPDVKKLQKDIKDDQLLVSFFIGDSHIYVFTLDEDNFDVVRKEKPDTFHEDILGLITAIQEHNKSEYIEEAFSAFQLLLLDVLKERKEVRRLLIIPHDILGYVPFEALLTRPAAQNSGYADLDYLIRSYDVAYHFSAFSMFEPAKFKSRYESNFIGFVPNSKQSLAHGEEEVRTISKLLKGSFISGEEATEYSFKQMASGHRVVHVTSHGIIDDQNPLYSKLLFTSLGDSIEDGELNTYELYDLQLNADLVCLSACNTGVGKYYQGEGILSLAHGFAYSGVPNLLVSLWKVSDEPTRDIMTYFYDEVKGDRDYSEALYLAKIRYLNESDNITADPYYWSSFILINGPPDESGISSWVWITCSAIFLLTILYFARRRLKSSSDL